MSFPVKRPVWRPRIREILFSTKCFLLDEFSNKTACVTPQNSPIDDWMSSSVSSSRPGFWWFFLWMSFPVKRSPKFPRNSSIRVKEQIVSDVNKSVDFSLWFHQVCFWRFRWRWFWNDWIWRIYVCALDHLSWKFRRKTRLGFSTLWPWWVFIFWEFFYQDEFLSFLKYAFRSQ